MLTFECRHYLKIKIKNVSEADAVGNNARCYYSCVIHLNFNSFCFVEKNKNTAVAIEDCVSSLLVRYFVSRDKMEVFILSCSGVMTLETFNNSTNTLVLENQVKKN